MRATEHAVHIARIAAQAAADKLATNIVLLDVGEKLGITDVFVLASGQTDRQVKAIVDGIQEALAKEGVKPARREGELQMRWVLLDYLDVVVHVQQAEERVFYDLERLWKDCPVIEWADRELPE